MPPAASPSPPIGSDDRDETASSLVPQPGTHLAEPTAVICRPLIPLGDLARAKATTVSPATSHNDTPFGFVRAGDDLHWQLAVDDWRLTSPPLAGAGDGRTASAESVLDVYVGLLAAFAKAGLPADNTVRFAPGPFARELGWGAGSARGTPTGRQYRQLELALDYLRQANIESEAVRARLETIYGARVLRANVSVLQSWSKTALVAGFGKAVQVEARFSDHFAALLRQEQEVVHYCAARYAELPRGVPRALFRYVEGLRAAASSPLVTVAASTVLAHIGSRRRDVEPSRMKAILDEPHQLLYANRVLGDLPGWSQSDSGEWHLTYLLECPPDLGPLLEETALAFGITRGLAHQWRATRLDRLTEVLAAAVQGILTPTRTIGAMAHHYVEEYPGLIDAEALPHFEPGRGIVPPRQRCQEFEFLKEQYHATRIWLNERPDVERALQRRFWSEARPAWVTDGLVLIAARRMRRADDLRTWRRRVSRAR